MKITKNQYKTTELIEKKVTQLTSKEIPLGTTYIVDVPYEGGFFNPSMANAPEECIVVESNDKEVIGKCQKTGRTGKLKLVYIHRRDIEECKHYGDEWNYISYAIKMGNIELWEGYKNPFGKVA